MKYYYQAVEETKNEDGSKECSAFGCRCYTRAEAEKIARRHKNINRSDTFVSLYCEQDNGESVAMADYIIGGPARIPNRFSDETALAILEEHDRLREVLEYLHCEFSEKRSDICDMIYCALEGKDYKLKAEHRYAQFDFDGTTVIYDTYTTQLDVINEGEEDRTLDGHYFDEYKEGKDVKEYYVTITDTHTRQYTTTVFAEDEEEAERLAEEKSEREQDQWEDADDERGENREIDVEDVS